MGNVKAQELSMIRYAEVYFSRSQCEHSSRYTHKYYLPQELRASIFPVDIDGITSCFYDDYNIYGVNGGYIPENVPDCVIKYKDLGLEKHINGDTVRRVLLAIAGYYADDRALLTPEEQQAALNLNTWFIEWERDLHNRCIQLSRDMERQVRSGDKWLSDYEIDVEVDFYVRDDDPFSLDNMPDGSKDDIDCDTGLLCTMKLLVALPIFLCGSGQRWGIGDGQDHNDCHTRQEEIYNVRHCATFHELFRHMHMPVKHAGRIGRVYTDIIIRHQNGISIELKGGQATTIRDEARIRDEFVLCEDIAP